MDRVCHFEVPYSDYCRAKKFYQQVFGWQICGSPGDTPYSIAITTNVDENLKPMKAGGINGGMFPRTDQGVSKTPVIVIEVKSCGQRIRDVERAGGSVVSGPEEIPNKGIYAQVKDSEDNIIGIWQSIG